MNINKEIVTLNKTVQEMKESKKKEYGEPRNNRINKYYKYNNPENNVSY